MNCIMNNNKLQKAELDNFQLNHSNMEFLLNYLEELAK